MDDLTLDKIKEKIKEKLGECPDNLTLTSEFVRFGKKKELWLTSRSWVWKNKEYIQVTFGSWKTGEQDTYKSWEGKEETKAFKKKYTQEMKETNEKLKKEKEKKHQECKDKWSKIFSKCKTNDNHEYLKLKEVEAHCSKVDANDVLLIPLYDETGMVGVQRIIDNEKRFSSGIKLKGSFCPLDKFKQAEYCYIAEGFATAATIQEITDIPTICAFNCHNIAPVIETIRSISPKIKIIIASDSDKVGTKQAFFAAKKHPDVVVRVPKFSVSNPSWSDFNDLCKFIGKDEAQKQLTFSPEEFAKIECLGHNLGRYYYSSNENQQICSLSRSEHKVHGFLAMIANLSFWQKKYPILNGDGEVVGTSWTSAAADMMGKCHKAGIFDPKNVRGTGVWKDGNNYVINTGQEVVNIPKVSPFHYQKTMRVDFGQKCEIEKEDIIYLVDAFKKLSYKNELDYFYLSSFIIQAQIFSVLPWRFHVWVFGESGTGKTTVLKKMKDLMINAIGVRSSSAAGIRQEIKSDATTVIYDEAEASGEIDGVIKLARELSSKDGFVSVKGTVTGNSINHNTDCVFLFGSIQKGKFTKADESRIFKVEMDDTKNQDKKIYQDFLEKLDFFIENKKSLFYYVYSCIPVIMKNQEIIKTILEKDYKVESRQADQLSIAMACFYVYFSDEIIKEEKIHFIIKEVGILNSKYQEDNDENTSEECLNFILQIRIDKSEETTVAQAIDFVRENNKAQTDWHENRLGNLGIKVLNSSQIFIAKKSFNMSHKINRNFPDYYDVLRMDDEIFCDLGRSRITQLSKHPMRGIIVNY